MWALAALAFLLVVALVAQTDGGDYFYRLCNHNRPHPRFRRRPVRARPLPFGVGRQAGRVRVGACLS